MLRLSSFIYPVVTVQQQFATGNYQYLAGHCGRSIALHLSAKHSRAAFDGKKLSEIPSIRRFKFTEFIKLDSGHLSGDFIYFDNGKQGKSTFLSPTTLNFMRNEILASYGFIFKDTVVSESFKIRQLSSLLLFTCPVRRTDPSRGVPAGFQMVPEALPQSPP